jgi:hypothetical protein
MLTQKLQKILDRYGVQFRDGQQRVQHHGHGFATLLTAAQFAVFEAALKANYILLSSGVSGSSEGAAEEV